MLKAGSTSSIWNCSGLALRLILVDANDWLQELPPAPDEVISEAVNAKALVALIGAASKTKKTFFLLQLAYSLATGTDFLAWKIPKPRKTLLLQAELAVDDMHRRAYRMADALYHLSLDGDDSSVIARDYLKFCNLRGTNFDPEVVLLLLEDFPAEVVIFDPLYSFFFGEENSSKDMNALLSKFRSIAEEGNLTVLFSHHDPKSGTGNRETHERGAGSSVLGRYYDACFTLDKHESNEESDLVVSTLFRSYPPKPDVTISFQPAGYFTVSEAPPVKKTRRTGANPRNAIDNETLAEQALPILADKILRPQELQELLKKHLGVGVKKAEEVRKTLETLPGIGRAKQGSRYEYIVSGDLSPW